MRTLYESLLDDLDDLDKSIDLKQIVKKWILENIEFVRGLKISDKPNNDGKYEVSADKVVIGNISLTSLANDMFVWKKIRLFNCSYCDNLTSLEGAPKEVGGDFYCNHCDSLKSLKGAPEKVGMNFCCYDCKSLKSLEGAPKEVGGKFDCSWCASLKSYELPKGTKIKGNFIK